MVDVVLEDNARHFSGEVLGEGDDETEDGVFVVAGTEEYKAVPIWLCLRKMLSFKGNTKMPR